MWVLGFAPVPDLVVEKLPASAGGPTRGSPAMSHVTKAGRPAETAAASLIATIASSPALPTHLTKRDGARVPFDLRKIASAIARAGAATGEFHVDEAERLAAAVGNVLAHRIAGGTADIERVKDTVEHTLAAAGYFDTARDYIV